MDPFKRSSVMDSERKWDDSKTWGGGLGDDLGTYFEKVEQTQFIDGRDVECEEKKTQG